MATPFRRSIAVRLLIKLCYVLIAIDILVTIPAVALWLFGGYDLDALVTALGLLLGGLGVCSQWLKRFLDPTPTDKTTTAQPSARPDDRTILLNKVREFWIEGVFEPACIGQIWLDLEIEHKPEAVEPQIHRQFKGQHVDPVTLDSGEKIVDIFQREGRALLILGEPGSGKTMTLLELAKDLLARAEQTPRLPVPVVMNLSSWAEKHPEQFEDWLVERLTLDYQLPRKAAPGWIANGDLLFLLDGLDEVAEDYRADCVKAINVFWRGQDWSNNGIVICCRVAEYTALPETLHLESAVILRPLTLTQAYSYLDQLGPKWEGLRAAVPGDPMLGEFATSPLMLNIMAVAYEGSPLEQISSFSRKEDQIQHLFNHYIARCLKKDAPHPKYNRTKTRHYLSWLAQKMRENDQSIFYIESLQPDWLTKLSQQKNYWRTSIALIYLFLFLFFGILFGLVYEPIVGVIAGLVYGLVCGLFFETFGGVGESLINKSSKVSKIELRHNKITAIESIQWSWIGGCIGLIIALFANPILYLFILIFNILKSKGILKGPIALCALLITGLLCQILVAIGLLLVLGPSLMLPTWLFLELFFASLFGLKKGIIRQHVQPNEGIRRSLSNGLIIGPIFGVVAALISSLVFNLATNSIGIHNGLENYLLILIPYFVFDFTLSFGGRAVFLHILLRTYLYHTRVAPLNFAEFLQYTSKRHLTRQVGGGFMFRHRMLQQHSADHPFDK